MKRSELRGIPSVDKLAQALGDTDMPRPTVVSVIRRELVALRKDGAGVHSFEEVLSRVRSCVEALGASRIQPVINGTGILIHTNFGRAPLGSEVMDAVYRAGTRYNNLEYGLTEGGRGGRAAYLEYNLALLCGAEAATVVNNNASALVLVLRHFCGEGAPAAAGARRNRRRRESPRSNQVVISRGELIQIGGGFRIPELLEATGARLCEVGTTNKTSLADFARAITEETALILKVHRSNFYMDGFVESPSTEDIAQLAREKRIPFVEDLGSGAVIQTQTVQGLEHEPTAAEVLRKGVDVVCFSGDKLFGGPQSGIIAGKAKLIAALKREPLFRALRCDKLILAALQATVDIHLRSSADLSSTDESGHRLRRHSIPLFAMLQTSNDGLQGRAEEIIAKLVGSPVKATIGQGRSQIGGGALPRSIVRSTTLDISSCNGVGPQELAARLRSHRPPIIGYIERDRLKLDLRTVFADQDAEIVAALRVAIS
jgi:L-seryl-tRNA(Ser) seleniumtransferase